MAQTIGYQRGTTGLGALQNANATLFTHPASETYPIRVINAGVNLSINNDTANVIAMQLAVRQGNDSTRGTVVAGKWVKNTNGSNNLMYGLDLAPAGAVFTAAYLPSASGQGFSNAPQGGLTFMAAQSPSSTMAISDPSRRTFTAGGLAIDFNTASTNSTQSGGNWEINPPYFWMLPGDSLLFSATAWYTDASAARTYNTGGGVVGWNFITIKDTGT